MDEVVRWVRRALTKRPITVLLGEDDTYVVDGSLTFQPDEFLDWANAHRRGRGLESFPLSLAAPVHQNRRRHKGLLHLLTNA